MNKIVRNIPNAITCGNLLCGCLAIVKAFEGDLVWAAYLVGIAAVLDFFDGFAARMLKVSSPIGKDLDSLADMVTFGVVPGVVMYQILKNVIRVFAESNSVWGDLPAGYYFLPFIAFLIPVLSAVRLAIFNNDSRQSESFIGLPTPANAIFFSSFPLIIEQVMTKYAAGNPFEQLMAVSSDPLLALSNNPWLLLVLVSVFSGLLVAPLPLFSLKFKSFGWKGNEIRFIFLILSVALIGFLQFIGIPLVIVLYILMSIVNNLLNRSKKSA